MNIKHLNDESLHESLTLNVKSERKILHVIIAHIQEVNRRKLYLKMYYNTLYEYLIKAQGYSGGSAQRRIEAAQLVDEIPEIAAKIVSGEINLSTIGEIHKATQMAKRIHQERVSTELKAELVAEIFAQTKANDGHVLSKPETQKICATALNIPVIEDEVISTQRNGSVRIQMTLSAEQYAKFELAKGLVAHKNFELKRTQRLADVFETCLDLVIESKFGADKKESRARGKSQTTNKRKGESKVEVNSKSRAEPQWDSVDVQESRTQSGNALSSCDIAVEMESDDVKSESTIELESESKPWKSITPKRRMEILRRDQCCQYTDNETGHKCESTFQLEIDHIHPKWAGGSNDKANLRILCRLCRIRHNADNTISTDIITESVQISSISSRRLSTEC